jgi:hypothetical protein
MRSSKNKLFATTVAVVALAAALKAPIPASAATTAGTVTFKNTPLTFPQGSSEPSISIGSDGTMAIDALSWLTNGTLLWIGPYGSTPTLHRAVDAAILKAGAVEFGGGDATLTLVGTAPCA